ncbi:alkaline phytoceramidase [Punctularia strigosozonata HHB-11173 SS5]|uniref:alkaline phytoceramidase n=1 Tax=Punctularia strigosozonata (strain HHB-11173) TaxID=741275 RepID=UPI0004416EF8|nr:alkaline phytoceramidase [Punctularia strigosozonata HHB-11173 SS5]EIN13481.1 alkaline phytoceramidase [Punctularia strigosozonata HHB-11173 SS5]
MSGYWGPATSTIDWCEQNYQFSHYLAELANSLSNGVTVLFAAWGAHKVRQNGLPLRYALQFVFLAIVGIGSFAFHATLLYEAQLADELPMLLSSSYSIFLLLDTGKGFANIHSWLAIAIAVINVAFTASYLVYRSPPYFQSVFAFTMLFIGFRCTQLLRHSAPSVIPPQTKQRILSIFWTGGLLFIFAFGIWNIDNEFCARITVWKHALGWPNAFLLEGHAWWHALTAAGTYLMMEGVTYTMLCVKDDHNRYGLDYTLGVPHVVRIPARKSD